MTPAPFPTARRAADRSPAGRLVAASLARLPEGHLLPAAAWAMRHRWIVVVLWCHVVGLTAFGVAQGYSVGHSAVDGLLVAVSATVASIPSFSRRVRSLAASIGLVTASAVLVHRWGGQIEAHFHFFVVIPVLVLYQDWAPLLLALGYVLVHHGVMGVVDPDSVYNHPAAADHPWRWALVHAVFVLGTTAAGMVSWRANEQLLREPLTGLPGRSVFSHRVDVALDRIRRTRRSAAVLFLDLDRFKVFNDTLGHVTGDALLVEAARRVRSCVRAQDTVARLGGDEFAVLCADVPGQEEVLGIAHRINERMREPFALEQSAVQLSASIGIAFTTGEDVTADDLIADADTAMYEAKALQGDRFVVFDEPMRRKDEHRMGIEVGLRRALSDGELRVHYQPIVSASAGGTVGFEALVRWEHPDRGLLAPGEFIPVAEYTGLIIPIGRWVMEQACLEARGWGDRPDAEPYVSVNISARQFLEPQFVDTVADILRRTGVPARRLVLELTESMLMEHGEGPARTLHQLHDLGVRVFLDDFGTGYSSLAYLRNFALDALKIDRSFIAELGRTPQSDAIVAAIVTMAEALGLDVVSEGIETSDQLSAITTLGCTFAQGYHLGRPAPPHELAGFLPQPADGSAAGAPATR